MLRDVPDAIGPDDDPIVVALREAGASAYQADTSRLQQGVYLGHLNLDATLELRLRTHGLTLDRYRWADELFRASWDKEEREYISSYIVCDNLEQALAYWKAQIDDPEHQFVLTLCEIRREDQPARGGWRWHKWGPYIGSHNPSYEYLYDEKDIPSVFVAHLCQVVEL